jgi:hypothetical protein
MLNLYAGITDRTDASSTSFRDCAAESPCILVYLLCEDLSSTSSLLACELCADVLLRDMTDDSFWNGIWRWFRSAGSDEPMIATVGSTCVGIQNVYPYLSHCGGIARLICVYHPGSVSPTSSPLRCGDLTFWVDGSRAAPLHHIDGEFVRGSNTSSAFGQLWEKSEKNGDSYEAPSMNMTIAPSFRLSDICSLITG